MKIYNIKDLTKEQIKVLFSRVLSDDSEIELASKELISGVKTQGDAFLKTCNATYDNYAGDRLFLDETALKSIAESTPVDLQKAINLAVKNITLFHRSQIHKEEPVETSKGVLCWRETRAIEKVGIYVPGGSAVLPSTFLMLVIPALLAGCKEIIVCTPPKTDGTIDKSIAYCATKLGIKTIYLSGGAQAIAAMAFGTETVPKAYKIFGPGNRYVMQAKAQLQQLVAIDLPAGPSEVLILADALSDPQFVASDLLAQAEHGIDSQVILISNSSETLAKVQSELAIQLSTLPRQEIAKKALENSFMILVDNLDQGISLSNEYAPEHLILALEKPRDFLSKIENAGSVFLGTLTAESAGDYASGTNHTLPTSGNAKAYSGVSIDSFLKKITFQEINNDGLKNIGPTIEVLAEAEGLFAHKNSITLRLNKYGN